MALKSELDTIIGTEVDRMKTVLPSHPDGYYIIPDIDSTMYGDDRVRLMTYLIMKLSREFTGYRWWTTEMFGSKGIRVNWEKKS